MNLTLQVIKWIDVIKYNFLSVFIFQTVATIKYLLNFSNSHFCKGMTLLNCCYAESLVSAAMIQGRDRYH